MSARPASLPAIRESAGRNRDGRNQGPDEAPAARAPLGTLCDLRRESDRPSPAKWPFGRPIHSRRLVAIRHIESKVLQVACRSHSLSRIDYQARDVNARSFVGAIRDAEHVACACPLLGPDTRGRFARCPVLSREVSSRSCREVSALAQRPTSASVSARGQRSSRTRHAV